VSFIHLLHPSTSDKIQLIYHTMVGHIIGKKVLDIIYRSDYTSLAVTIL